MTKAKFSKPKKGCLVKVIPQVIPNSGNERGIVTPRERQEADGIYSKLSKVKKLI